MAQIVAISWRFFIILINICRHILTWSKIWGILMVSNGSKYWKKGVSAIEKIIKISCPCNFGSNAYRRYVGYYGNTKGSKSTGKCSGFCSNVRQWISHKLYPAEKAGIFNIFFNNSYLSLYFNNINSSFIYFLYLFFIFIKMWCLFICIINLSIN